MGGWDVIYLQIPNHVEAGLITRESWSWVIFQTYGQGKYH